MSPICHRPLPTWPRWPRVMPSSAARRRPPRRPHRSDRPGRHRSAVRPRAHHPSTGAGVHRPTSGIRSPSATTCPERGQLPARSAPRLPRRQGAASPSHSPSRPSAVRLRSRAPRHPRATSGRRHARHRHQPWPSASVERIRAQRFAGTTRRSPCPTSPRTHRSPCIASLATGRA